MSTAGSGDVLTGMIAALIGQGLEPRMAAELAVYGHGWLGDKVSETKGIGLVASDLIENMTLLFHKD